MPSLKERIDADLKDAMRSKDELRHERAADAQERGEVQGSRAGRVSAGRRRRARRSSAALIKQRRDSVEQFRAGGRAELADKEEKEIARSPDATCPQMSADELRRRGAGRRSPQAGAKSPRTWAR